MLKYYIFFERADARPGRGRGSGRTGGEGALEGWQEMRLYRTMGVGEEGRSERNRGRSRRMNRAYCAPRREGGHGDSILYAVLFGGVKRRGEKGVMAIPFFMRCYLGVLCAAAGRDQGGSVFMRCYSGVLCAAAGVSRPDFSRAGFAAARTRERM